MTRRVLIGTGVAVVGAGGLLVAAEATGRLDDVADAVGVDPKPRPDPGDTSILRRAAEATATLLASIESSSSTHPSLALSPVAAIVREQLDAIGGAAAAAAPAPPPDAAAAIDALVTALDTARKDRRRDALAAGSPALVRVLASMSAGHAQCVQTVRDLR